MSLVVSVGGKIESYYSYRDENLKPVRRSGLPNPVEEHDPDKDSPREETASKNDNRIKESYGKQPEKAPQRKSRVFARDIMSKPVRTVTKDTTVLDAVHSMNKFNNKHLLVAEENLIVGIISDRDLLSYSWNQESLHTEIEGIMSNEVILAKEDTEIRILASIMLEENISAVPIVDEQYQLKGIVTQTDLLTCLMKNMPLDVIV